MKQYAIPCQHETNAVPSNQQVPDYHHLSEQEILELLLTAKRIITNEDDQVATQRAASIQVRLCQGIVGYMCPRNIDGRVANRQNQIDRMYVDFLKHPEQYEDEIENLAIELHRLMQA